MSTRVANPYNGGMALFNQMAQMKPMQQIGQGLQNLGQNLNTQGLQGLMQSNGSNVPTPEMNAMALTSDKNAQNAYNAMNRLSSDNKYRDNSTYLTALQQQEDALKNVRVYDAINGTDSTGDIKSQYARFLGGQPQQQSAIGQLSGTTNSPVQNLIKQPNSPASGILGFKDADTFSLNGNDYRTQYSGNEIYKGIPTEQDDIDRLDRQLRDLGGGSYNDVWNMGAKQNVDAQLKALGYSPKERSDMVGEMVNIDYLKEFPDNTYADERQSLYDMKDLPGIGGLIPNGKNMGYGREGADLFGQDKQNFGNDIPGVDVGTSDGIAQKEMDRLTKIGNSVSTASDKAVVKSAKNKLSKNPQFVSDVVGVAGSRKLTDDEKLVFENNPKIVEEVNNSTPKIVSEKLVVNTTGSKAQLLKELSNISDSLPKESRGKVDAIRKKINPNASVATNLQLIEEDLKGLDDGGNEYLPFNMSNKAKLTEFVDTITKQLDRGFFNYDSYEDLADPQVYDAMNAAFLKETGQPFNAKTLLGMIDNPENYSKSLIMDDTIVDGSQLSKIVKSLGFNISKAKQASASKASAKEELYDTRSDVYDKKQFEKDTKELYDSTSWEHGRTQPMAKLTSMPEKPSKLDSEWLQKTYNTESLEGNGGTWLKNSSRTPESTSQNNVLSSAMKTVDGSAFDDTISKYGIDKKDIKGAIKKILAAETNYGKTRSKDTGNKSSYGITQIRPDTATSLTGKYFGPKAAKEAGLTDEQYKAFENGDRDTIIDVLTNNDKASVLFSVAKILESYKATKKGK